MEAGITQLRIRLLGSFQASLDDKLVLNFESNKVRALLAYLVVERGQTHRREKLAALFWPEMPAKRASSNLSQAIYNLRHAIHDQQANLPYLLRQNATVQFNPASDFWLDVEDFNRRLGESKVQDHTSAALNESRLVQLQAAIDLYRGDFLSGLGFDSSLAYDEWCLVIRQQLKHCMLQGLHLLAENHASQGDHTQALSCAWRQVELDPLSESAYRQLMLFLAANGQRSQALTQFKQLQALLSEELDVPPEPETMALYNQLRSQEGSFARSKRKWDNLPANQTPVIGRQQELAELQEQLTQPEPRMLTILGPGGSGKSHLALEAARANREHFSDGVCFVALNPLQSPGSILPALMEALDLPRSEGSDHLTQLVNYLRAKHLLLVLDGFEHLLAGAGRIAELLQQTSNIKLLVTSRMRLNLSGEQLFPLGGLRYPQCGASATEILKADAVQLLVDGLRRTRPDYQPGSDDLAYLPQICQQVLGMPLGILLAASWGGTLSVQEIADMVSQNLDFLAADWSDVPARQRSLRDTFDYTWNLLDERQRAIFAALSVFRGAFTRRAARAVSSASPYELRDLVDRSLLWHHSPGQYEIHELLRQYGRDQLAECAAVEQAVYEQHSSYYLDQLANFGETLKGADQSAALTSLDMGHENYRVAFNWSASRGAAAQVLDALCLYYDLRHRYADGEGACQAFLLGLSQEENDVDLWLLKARILTWQSRFRRLLGQTEAASQLLGNAFTHLESAKTFRNQETTVDAFLVLEQGNNHFNNDRTEAASCYQHSLEIYRGLGDAWGTAKVLGRLGLLAYHTGSFEEAVKLYSECLEIHRSIGDPRGIAITLINLGQNLLRLGLTKQGERYINEGVTILQQIGDMIGVARGYFELARYYFWSGEFARAVQLNGDAIPIFEDFGDLDQFNFANIGIGLGLSHLGRYAETITRVAKNISFAQEINAYREIGLAHVILGMAYLGNGDFHLAEKWASKSVEQYRDLNQQEELSLALAILAYTQLGLNYSKQAVRYLCEVLQIGIDIRGIYPILYVLFAASAILIKRGDIAMAIEISVLAEQFPFVGNSRWFEDIAGREIASAGKNLPPDVVSAAQERGKARDIWKTASELLEEFSQPVR